MSPEEDGDVTEASSPAEQVPAEQPAAEAPPAEAVPSAELPAEPPSAEQEPPLKDDAKEPEGGDEDGGAGRRPEPSRAGPAERRPRRHFGRRKVCAFCVDKVASIDYKDSAKLRRYLSDRGRIEARRKTGTCAKHQRWLALALKRARHLALLPYTAEHIRVSGMSVARR